MASGPITPWEIDGEPVETVSDFIVSGSKITADGVCNHEIKRCLLLGRKVMSSLDSIFKSRDITLWTKFLIVKAMVFQASCMYVRVGPCRGWMQKNRCFQSVVLEKTLESPLDCKEIKPINPKGNHLWILEGLMLKLKLNTLATWCEDLTHWKRPWCWERLRAGGEGDDRG